MVDLDAQVWFHLNKEGKSPLYLAVEAGYKAGIEHTLEQRVTEENFGKWRKGKSPIHAAIVVKNTGIQYLYHMFSLLFSSIFFPSLFCCAKY